MESNFIEGGALHSFGVKKDFEGNSGKNIQIILGRDLFIKGFDDQLTNSKKNSEKKIIVNLPENFPKKEIMSTNSRNGIF